MREKKIDEDRGRNMKSNGKREKDRKGKRKREDVCGSIQAYYWIFGTVRCLGLMDVIGVIST